MSKNTDQINNKTGQEFMDDKLKSISNTDNPFHKKGIGEKLKVFFKDPKKRIITIVIVLILIMTSIGFYFLLFKQQPKEAVEQNNVTNNEVTKAAENKPEQFASPLDGVMTDKTTASKHPLAVIVENHIDARPQSGLDKASLVYEAIAEGGITRFLALFTTNEAEKVGPVRSVRTYFVDWAHGFNAFLAHVGGNMDALDKINSEKTNDLDQFKFSTPYWREYANNLATEHTMYSSTIKLREQAEKNKYNSANDFSVYKFKEDAELVNRPESQKITVNFSSDSYNVVFNYDKNTNTYKRFQDEKAHVDRITKDQISPKNVIVMTVNRKPVVTRINEQGYEMTTIGQGKAKIFFDGKEIDGTWKKGSAQERETFYDQTGNEITFDRGQFWICVIPPESSVVVQ